MFLHVRTVTHTSGYELRVGFSDGVVKDVDLSGELYGEVFAPLRDPEFFRRVVVNDETNTVEWPNGADFAPGFLYEIGREVRQEALAQGSEPASPPLSLRLSRGKRSPRRHGDTEG